MPTLIINADDLGYDPAIDRGILDAHERGLVSSATLMVNTPFAADAARAARPRPRLGIGLHLNLARGAPLSPARGLVGADGQLDPARLATAGHDELLAEIAAQVRAFETLVGRPPTHLDSHKHLHAVPAVFAAIIEIARGRALPVRSIDAEMRGALRAAGVRTPDAFVGDTGAVAYWSPTRLLEVIRSLRDGVTELMCHPGYAPEVVQTSYGVQREGERAALTDPEVLLAVRQAGISVGTFSAVRGGD